MTTHRREKPTRFRPLWQVRPNETGELRFIPIQEKKNESKSGGTIYATVTSAVLKSPEKARELSEAVTSAGGSVTRVVGRMVSVDVPASCIADVGDAFESFGCQWDFEREG
jgi:hypothetical protein